MGHKAIEPFVALTYRMGVAVLSVCLTGMEVAVMPVCLTGCELGDEVWRTPRLLCVSQQVLSCCVLSLTQPCHRC